LNVQLNTRNYNSGSEKLPTNASTQPLESNSPEPATTEAVDPNEASKIANLLEGLTFPATKGQIKEYIIDSKSISISNENARYISQSIENKLLEGKLYNNTYEIEEALGLVFKKNNADGKSPRKKKNIRVKRRK
jgi:hypothetical protein